MKLPPARAQKDVQSLPPRQPSALDYSNYIAKRYPMIVKVLLTVPARENRIYHLSLLANHSTRSLLRAKSRKPKLCLGEARQSAPQFSSMLPVLQKQSRIYTLTAVGTISRQFSLVCLLPNFRNGSACHPEATQAIHGSQGGRCSNPELNRIFARGSFCITA